MDKTIGEIVELYFKGGDLKEILRVAREGKEDRDYIEKLEKEIFKNWR